MKGMLVVIGILFMAGCSKDATAPIPTLTRQDEGNTGGTPVLQYPAIIEFDGGRSEAEPVDDCQDAIEFRNFVKKADYSLWLEWHGGTAADTVDGE